MRKTRPCRKSLTGQFETQFRSRLSPHRFAAIRRTHGPRLRRAKKLSAYQLGMCLVFHLLQSHGTLHEHVKRLTGIDISDSALSQRRARLPWEILAEILRVVLRPLAVAERQPGAFYRGLRLVGLDGTMFSVFNTPWISKSLKKAISRRA